MTSLVTSRRDGLQATAMTNLLIVLVGLINGLILARLLGPADRGQLSKMVQPLALASGVVPLGTDEEAVRRDDPGFTHRALVTAIASGTVAAAILMFFLSRTYRGFELIVGLPMLSAWTAILLATPRRRGSYTIWNRVRLFAAVAAPVALLGGHALGASPLGAGVMASAAATIVALFLSASISAEARAKPRSVTLVSYAELKGSVPHLTSRMSSNLAARGDLLVLGFVAADNMVGLYAIALTVASPVLAIGGAVGTQSFAETARGSTFRVERSRGLMLVGLVAIGLIATPPAVRIVVGAEFEGAIEPARILLIANLLAVPRIAISSAARGRGEMRAANLIDGLTAVAVLLPIPLVSTLGLTPVAMVSLIGYSAGTTLALLWSRQR